MKHYFKYESGRSMTEMLSTLAIIGVLSVGAIGGYSYGMDKYRANQTVNDIMLRSINVINQLADGKIPDLSEWQGEHTLYPIGVERNNSLGQYAIVIENVPSRVCKMIGDSLKGQMDIYVGMETLEDKINEIDDPCDESDKNIMEFYFNAVSCNPACGEDEYCEFGICFKSVGTPRTWYPVCIEGAACTTEDGENGFCESDVCIPISGCTSNDECSPKEYCAVVNYTSPTERFPTDISGTCVKNNFFRYEINGKTYYVSATSMNWWNAEWACAKIGKEHLEIQEFYENYSSGSREPSNLSVQLSNLIGKLYVWTATARDTQHHITPLIGTTTNGFDLNENNHGRFAVCK